MQVCTIVLIFESLKNKKNTMMNKAQTVKKMKNIPAEAIALAQTIFEALAVIETMRPVVEELYYKNAVKVGCELPALEDCGKYDVIEAVVEAEKVEEWNALNDADFPSLGLTAKPGCCPLLSMESDIRQLKHQMSKIMFDFLKTTGVMKEATWEQIDGTHHYLKFAEIQMRMLARYVSADVRKYLPAPMWTK